MLLKSTSSFAGRALWYGQRLASMSGPEVWHRVQEQWKRAVSRYRSPDLAGLAARQTALPALPGFVDGLASVALDSRLLEAWEMTARQAASGSLHLLGQAWPPRRDPTRWHLDPATGRTWPADRFCFRVDFRHAEGLGDVKYVWELNRLQHLQAVAALSACRRDEDLARLCLEDLESWIDANPPFQGINWASGIELALRTVSILVTTSLLEPAVFSPRLRRKLVETLAAHGYWLRRYPSRFSSANNHLIAEAGALFLLGSLAPGFRDSTAWADYGRAVLIEESARQVHPDGVGAEQSPTYTAFTLEWLLLCAYVGSRIGRPFPPEVWQRLERAGEFLRWITDRGGHQPRIGDDDEGRVFHFHGPADGYVSSVLASLAAATDQADLAPPCAVPALLTGLFGPAPATTVGPTGVKRFAQGGYTVARFREAGREAMVVMDHGPLGYLSIAAHGHADALSIWLHLDAQPVLVDAGTYLYHSGAQWREHMRGTPAHNTLSIRGASSSQTAGAFNWSRKASVALLAWDPDPRAWRVEAEHDGFVPRFGLRHRRELTRAPDGSLVVTDTLQGTGARAQVEVGFLFHPDLVLDRNGTGWVVRHGQDPLLAIEHRGDLRGEIQMGQEGPLRGWYSPAFGAKVPAPRLVFAGRLPAGQPARTYLRILSP